MSENSEQPKKHGFFHDGFAQIYEAERASRKPANFSPEDLERRLKNLEERRGQTIDEALKQRNEEREVNPMVKWLDGTSSAVSTEEHNVGEAIGRIREMAEENNIPEERTKKIIAAEVSNEDTQEEPKSFKDIYPVFEMPEANSDFESPTVQFLNRTESGDAETK